MSTTRKTQGNYNTFARRRDRGANMSFLATTNRGGSHRIAKQCEPFMHFIRRDTEPKIRIRAFDAFARNNFQELANDLNHELAWWTVFSDFFLDDQTTAI
jgi:hypothetical protein